MTIFVVDDDDSVREALRALLESEGFEVVDLASGADLLGRADVAAAGCLVLDVHMPGMTGLEVLERFCRERKAIPAVLMTGRPAPEVVSAAKRAGVTLLRKPFSADDLMASINDALRRAA